jgi:hypothetical protein
MPRQKKVVKLDPKQCKISFENLPSTLSAAKAAAEPNPPAAPVAKSKPQPVNVFQEKWRLEFP